MPQQPGSYVTFPSRISPDVEGARRRNLEYMLSRSLLTREETIARYLGWDLATLAARFHPHEVGAQLDLGLLQQTFYFFYDDLFDTCLGKEPAHAYRLTRYMTRLVRLPATSAAPEPAFPLAEMFLELWNDTRRGRSAVWVERVAANWEDFFRIYVTEAVNRLSGTVLDLPAYLRYRQVAIGVFPVEDLAESLAGAETPPVLYESSCFRQMDHLTAEVVTLDNDLSSLEKDEANGELNNAVLLVCRERGLSRERALSVVQEMVGERVDRFHELTCEAARLYGLLQLSPQECCAAERYIDGRRAMMRGSHDWGNTSERYNAAGVAAVRKSAGIEDRISELPAEIHPHGTLTPRPAPAAAPTSWSTWAADPYLRGR